MPVCQNAALEPLVACLKVLGPSIATCACERRAAAMLLLYQDPGGLLIQDDLRTAGVGVGVVTFGVSTGGDTSSSSLSFIE